MKNNSILNQLIYRFWGTEDKTFLKPLKDSLFLAILFFFFSSAYIIVSDIIAANCSDSIYEMKIAEQVKGLIFLSILTLIMFIISYKYLKKIKINENQLLNYKKIIIAKEREAIAGLMASSIAHDINNLMTVILFTLNILTDNDNVSTKEKKLISDSLEASNKLLTLTKTLSLTGKQKYSSHFQLFNIGKIINDIVNITHSIKKTRDCRITIKQLDEIEALVKPQLISRSVTNLILNAADATENKGIIEISLVAQKTGFCIEVSDNGHGIQDINKEKIFEPFYTSKNDGSGLGMLSVQACVTDHNGTISIGKSSLGGAIFKLFIPYKQDTAGQN